MYQLVDMGKYCICLALTDIRNLRVLTRIENGMVHTNVCSDTLDLIMIAQ